MRKFNLITIPLITMPFLAGCVNTKIEHFVTFDTKGGTHIATQRIKDGETAVLPTPEPTRDNYVFKGWYTTDPNPTPIEDDKYDFNTKVTNDITLYARWEGEPRKISHHFKFTGNNCLVEKEEIYETDILVGIPGNFQITLKDGYSLPTKDEEHFKIITGNNVTYNEDKGVITISEMTSDVEIIATAVPIEYYKFSFSGTDCTMNGSPTYEENNIEAGADRQYTILPDAGHVLPEEITIPEPIKSFVSYSKGIITIENMSGDVTLENVIAPEEEIEYSINFSGTNCKAKGGGVTEFTQSFQTTRSSKDTSNLVLTLALDDESYELPTSINILFDGVLGKKDDYAYDKNAKTITIIKKANVLIDVKAINPTIVYHTITLDAGEGGTFVSGSQIFNVDVEEGSNLSYIIKTISSPIFNQKTFAYYTYDDGSLVEYDDSVDSDITLKAHYLDMNIIDPLENLDDIDWQTIRNMSVTNGSLESLFALGATKSITVNESVHKVRIIGFHQDVNKNDHKIGMTFEFANSISDENGYSLATLWNDSNNIQTSHYDYLNSSVRKALTKKGGGHILWAQKEQIKWSNDDGDPYKDRSVLEMMNDSNPGLSDLLTAPQKAVLCNVDGNWTPTEIKTDNEYDKLFLLAATEMDPNGGNYGESSFITDQYSYYKNTTSTDAKRIKKQVKGDVVYDNPSWIPGGSGQIFPNQVGNYAGYNLADDETKGGYVLLRSPNAMVPTGNMWVVDAQGSIIGNLTTYNCAFAVAPAFCI